MLITDIVDKYTKSSKECNDILNKFGVTVAPKTYEINQKQKANDSSNNKEEEFLGSLQLRHQQKESFHQSRFQRCWKGIQWNFTYDMLSKTEWYCGWWWWKDFIFFQQPSLDMFNKPFATVDVDESPVHSLFKSVLCLLHYILRQCYRDDSGQPLDDNISDSENHLSSAMQERVLQEMQRHDTFYENVKTDYVTHFLTALQKRSDQHDKCLSLWPDILQDRIPLNLLLERDLFVLWYTKMHAMTQRNCWQSAMGISIYLFCTVYV